MDIIKKTSQEYNGPFGDIGSASLDESGGRKKRRDQNYVVRDFITALALCHNVTPVFPNADEPDHKELEASSPDEIALVSFSDKIGLELMSKDQNSISIKNAAGVIEVTNCFNI
jgi:phospholipid-translocating ATPase